MSPKLTAQQRIELIKRVIEGKEPVARVCREAGISRVLFYSWLKRYKEAGEAGLEPGRRGVVRRTPLEVEEKVLELVKKNPTWSSKKLSAALGKALLGNHGVQNVLARHNLSKKKQRLAFAQAIEEKKPKFIPLTPQNRLEMLKRVVVGGEPVSTVAREYGISRTLFYRLKKRYESAALEEKLRALEPQKAHLVQYFRQTPERYEQAVLHLVVQHPEYGIRSLVANLPQVAGVPIVGHHGVQNILRRHGLSLYEQRAAFAEGQVTPVTRGIGAVASYLTRFIAIPVEVRARIVQFAGVTALSAFLTVVIFGGLGYWVTIMSAVTGASRTGLAFASTALLMGSVFFLYSMKYYFTLAIVLSFSQQVEINGVNGRNGNGNGNGPSGFLAWLLGFGPSTPLGVKNGLPRAPRGVGLEPSLEHVTLEKQPFISVHIPLYNERNVVERLLAAVTSFDYPNYEVVIVDDSTDETTAIIREFIEQWKSQNTNNKLQIKLIHRESRAGFKGGALREALKVSFPKAEFIVIFDADFVPYPDTLELFLKYFKVQNNMSEDYKKSQVAAVQGYQWHVLNKSENWITRGVRAEYAGSYVIERSGTEILSALKMIAGSVYMVRRDLLDKFGWGTSITEDFELTLKLYEAGYKVVFTPYIQAPAECVSTIQRLVRQRMRWAEGHSHNVRKMFSRLMFGHYENVNTGSPTSANDQFLISNYSNQAPNTNSQLGQLGIRSIRNSGGNQKVFIPSPLSLSEKLEFLYLSPYYLQAFFFMVGTLSWLISETIFPARLPFWTSLWGWSLVLTNLLCLPLMNAVGLFLEESEEKDYLGLLSFVALSYIMVPFQAYATIKGFLEKEEGPWFRTPKTGKITDIFTRGRFYRLIAGILPGRVQTAAAQLAISNQQSATSNLLMTNDELLMTSKYLALATANNRFQNFHIRPRQIRWVGKIILGILLILSVTTFSMTRGVPEVFATNPNVFSLTASSSANLTAAWQLQADSWPGAENTATSVKPGMSVTGTFQFDNGLADNATSEDPTAGPDGNGWIYDTVFGTAGGDGIAAGDWIFTTCHDVTNTDNDLRGYLRVLVYRVEVSGGSIASNTLFFDTTTGFSTNEIWNNGSDIVETNTRSAETAKTFTLTQNRLYVEFWTVVTTGGDATDKNVFQADNTFCATDPSVDTPTVTIPEKAILFVIPATFIPYLVQLWMKKKQKVISCRR